MTWNNSDQGKLQCKIQRKLQNKCSFQNTKMCVVWGHSKIVAHRKAGKINLSESCLIRSGLESPLSLVYDTGRYSSNSEIIHLQGCF